MHPDTKLCYHARGMILRIYSDAYYLSEIKARNIAGGNFTLGFKDFHNTQKTNGSILNLSNIMKIFISSAAKSEVGGFFHSAKSSEPIRTTLKELVHPPTATLMQNYNSTFDIIVKDKVHVKNTKSRCMCFYWFQDIIFQVQVLLIFQNISLNITRLIIFTKCA